MTERGRKVAVVAHCLLNVNTKVHGLARYDAVHPVALRLIAEGAGLVQLPCPEEAHLGMNRWGMTRDQYDVPAYRRLCRGLARRVAEMVASLAADGCDILGVWGVDGSPSCGVNRSCEGYPGGEVGTLASAPTATDAPGPGVFMDEVRRALTDLDLTLGFEAVAEEG